MGRHFLDTHIYLLFQYFISIFSTFHGGNLTDSDNVIPRNLTPEVLQALRAVRFIAQHIKDADKDNEVGTQASQLSYSPIPIYLLALHHLGHLQVVLIFVAHFYWRVFSSMRKKIVDDGGETGSRRVLGVVVVYIAIFSASGESFSPPCLFYYCLLPLTWAWMHWIEPSPKCAANNCKILNHNFIFLLRFKFIERRPQSNILLASKKCIKPILV